MKATQGILETAIYARDLDAAEAFYRDVFGLERVSRVPGVSALATGAEAGRRYEVGLGAAVAGHEQFAGSDCE